MFKIVAAVNAPPALHPAPHPPAAGMAANFDAWAETQNPAECKRLRDDLTADIFRDPGELLASYIGRHGIVHDRVGIECSSFPARQGFFFQHTCHATTESKRESQWGAWSFSAAGPILCGSRGRRRGGLRRGHRRSRAVFWRRHSPRGKGRVGVGARSLARATFGIQKSAGCGCYRGGRARAGGSGLWRACRARQRPRRQAVRS